MKRGIADLTFEEIDELSTFESGIIENLFLWCDKHDLIKHSILDMMISVLNDFSELIDVD